jgi:hypothetical protein
MSNIIDFTGKNEVLPVYEISYTRTTDSDDVVTETFEGDAVMTTTFMGFVTDDQVLKFATPMENLVTIRLMNEPSSASSFDQ